MYFVARVSNSKGDVTVNLRGNLSKFCNHVAKCKQILLLWSSLVQRGSYFLGRGSFGLRRVKLKFAKCPGNFVPCGSVPEGFFLSRLNSIAIEKTEFFSKFHSCA